MTKNASDRVREAWNSNAAFWDTSMADGNEFFDRLIWPSVLRLPLPSRGNGCWMSHVEMA